MVESELHVLLRCTNARLAALSSGDAATRPAFFLVKTVLPLRHILQPSCMQSSIYVQKYGQRGSPPSASSPDCPLSLPALRKTANSRLHAE